MMNTEKSCGAVVFTKENREIKYLIIRSLSGIYGFPKGHMEGDETEAQTALREVREETGVSVRLLDGFRREDHYLLPQKPGTVKQVVYFLGYYEEQEPARQEEEISRVGLYSYEEAINVFQYHTLKKILTEADRFIKAAELPKAGDTGLEYVTLREKPEIEDAAADWFSSKWGVPKEAYLECMDAYLKKETELGWCLCLDGGRIVGGLGAIENDFHDRKDLSPNICAVFTEESYRSRGIAGRLLDLAVEDLRSKGISPVYLVTDHTGFYERYGWEFLCMVQGDGEPELTRMYIHR